MQIYRGMQIGTAKPTPQEMLGVPHHLLGILPPGERFSVAEYVTLAASCIEKIAARGHLPVLAGGTGLYLRSLLQSRPFSDEPENPEIRAALQKRAALEGGAALLEDLRAVDPETAERLHPNDCKRIVRALELYQKTGRTITEQNAVSQQMPERYRAGKIAITYADREVLYPADQ